MQNNVSKPAVPALTLAALGVVFGDIGTSPLYALKESFHATRGLPINELNILGILSLIFWTITLIVSLKYVLVIMRADNNGEGGIMALLALNRFKASNAMIPPSPLLSALMITKTYLSETIKVMVQKIKERIPRILSSLIGSPRVA